MKTGLAKASLSESRKRMVELMQSINFGRIEDLAVLNGHPVLDPKPRIIREIKFGGDNDPRPELDTGNFQLKAQVVELFQQFDRLGECTVEVLEIKHGLPFRMAIAEAAA